MTQETPKLTIGQILWERDMKTKELTGKLFEVVFIYPSGGVDIKPKDAPKKTIARRIFPFYGKLVRQHNYYTTSPHDDKEANNG